MIVVDASVVTAGLIDRDSPARPYVERNDIHVPFLADQEVMSAVRTLTLAGDIPPTDADQYVATWTEMNVVRHATAELVPRIWALRHNITPYDATYVALAASLGTDLVTRDEKLANAPGSTCEIVLV